MTGKGNRYGMKKALIVGSKGQDGTYLSKLLMSKNYEVWGIDINHVYSSGYGPIEPFDIMVYDDVLDFLGNQCVDEIYYLAAYHHSSQDFPKVDHPLFVKSFEINTIGLLNFLGAIAATKPNTRIFYAASSHIFGNPTSSVQDETTPLSPVCAYGISKTAGIHLCRYFREKHDLFCAVGILYNHESPLRPESFLSAKIIKGGVGIKQGRVKNIILGDLEALIDWGYAPDYVAAMHNILLLDHPEEFVVATGLLHTPKDWLEAVFSYLELDWTEYVVVDPGLVTKTVRTNPLCGDANKLKKLTGWKPTVDFRAMVEFMVTEELHRDVQ